MLLFYERKNEATSKEKSEFKEKNINKTENVQVHAKKMELKEQQQQRHNGIFSKRMMSVSQCALLHKWQHDCWKSSCCCSAFLFSYFPFSLSLALLCTLFVCIRIFFLMREQLLISWYIIIRQDICVMENDAAFVLLHYNFRWCENRPFCRQQQYLSSCDDVNNFLKTSRESENEKERSL